MKVTFKDLKQQKFTLDVEPTDLISAVKAKISEERGWAPETQKLIYSGKILKNEDTVESYKIEEKGFVVCVVNKPKAAPAPAAESSRAAVPATPAAQSSTSTPAQPAAPAQSTPAPAAAPGTPTPVRSGGGAAAPAGPGGLTMGAEREEAIQNMMSMGFERPQIETAMRAAFFNPDRAVEYLLNGIPENIQEQQAARAAPQEAAAQPAGDDDFVGGDDDEGVNLFDLAAQAGRGGAGGGGGRGRDGNIAAAMAAAGAGQGREAGLGNLDFLRQNPQFQQLRQVVQQQPQMLEPILQQLGAGNPQLAQLIAQNQDQFLQLLGEPGGDEDAALPPGAHAIAVTEEEREAIDRLCLLGFGIQQVTQAYFACDKNEELAANFLFDQPDEDDDAPQ